MSSGIVYKDLIAFHPGSYVKDIVDELNITQSEFAERVGTTPKTLSKIINSEDRISIDLADKLSKATGISIETWLNLQNAYDIKVKQIEDAQNHDELNIINLISFKYFKENSLVENGTYSKAEKISALRVLLNISNLTHLLHFRPNVSYRNTRAFEDEKSILNSNIMLEIATNIARDKSDKKVDTKKLSELLPEIRKMTRDDPSIFYQKLKDMLLDCGIVLVGLPMLPGAKLNGATKKFKNGSVLLLMTDRNKRSDIFWFSLFHELGHIMDNDYYSDINDSDRYLAKESKADQFSSNCLIPFEKYEEFIYQGIFTEQAIREFANDIEIHPSIVVGRLQNDNYIGYHECNHMRINYNIVTNR